MAGRFSLGKKSWLLIGVPLLAALLLLALANATDAERGDMTELEARLSATLAEMEGAGEVRAMVLTDTAVGAFGEKGAAEEVRGVIIVAQGAYDLGVRLRLQRAAMTLFKLSAEHVEVFSGREGSFE